MSNKFVMELNVPKFMRCITEALMAGHSGLTEKEAKIAVGTALTGSKDWDGHRSLKKSEVADAGTSATNTMTTRELQQQDSSRINESTEKGSSDLSD